MTLQPSATTMPRRVGNAGDGARAELERRNARLEREMAELERDRAQLEREHPLR